MPKKRPWGFLIWGKYWDASGGGIRYSSWRKMKLEFENWWKSNEVSKIEIVYRKNGKDVILKRLEKLI